MTVVYLINGNTHSKVLGCKSPYEGLYSKKPNYSLFRVFECACYLCHGAYTHHNLVGLLSVFLGYTGKQQGCICFDRVSNKYYITRHVHFLEHQFPFSIVSISPLHSTLDWFVSLPTPSSLPYIIPPIVSSMSPPCLVFAPVPIHGPSIVPSVNIHPMQTHGMTGHLKPKVTYNF